MDTFLKATAAVIVTVVLGLVITKQSKDLATVLVIFVCCIIIGAAVLYLQPVIDFLNRLQILGQLDSQLLTILLNTTGIGLLTEITVLVCTDAGNSSLGKALQILACAVILWLSVPLMNELITLVENIMGNI